MIVERWFRDCPDKAAREERLRQLALSKHLFDVLGEMLQEDYENAVNEMHDKQNFFMPAWSEYQASRLGKQEAIKKILKYLP